MPRGVPGDNFLTLMTGDRDTLGKDAMGHFGASAWARERNAQLCRYILGCFGYMLIG